MVEESQQQQPSSLQSILIVDDDEVVLKTLSLQLQDRGWEVLTAGTSAKALELFRDHPVTAVLVALGMSDMDGVELAGVLRQQAPNLIVVLMTGYPTLNTAIEGLKNPAYEYLVKPFRIEQLTMGIERARRELILIRENQELRQAVMELQTRLEQLIRSPVVAEEEGEEAGLEEVSPPSAPHAGYPAQVPGGDSGAIASYERQITPEPSEPTSEEEPDTQETADQEGEQPQTDD
ncbi:MAG: response regulator [Fidelibacterota bacterium]|nr:MAG: response regulator [Candidatus Neomarinimicrobiota bacterium]